MSTPYPVEQFVSGFQSQQSETLRLHEQYLRMEEEYARAFVQMTQLQSDLIGRLSTVPSEMHTLLPLFESLERSMARFHDHQAETLRVHQRYLETQERFAQSYSQAAGSQSVQAAARDGGTSAGWSAPAIPTAPSISTPAVPAAPVPTRGMPAPEAQRSVDTPAVAAPRVNGAANGKSAKNGSSVSHAVPAAQPAPSTSASFVASAAPATPVLPASPVLSKETGLETEKVKDALLAIVSDKTGYPVETLELDMDMEADLGIDSIKRVEILGAMQTQFPDLPQIDTAVLAELRTLGQIVDQFRVSSPAATSAPAPATEAVPADAGPATPAPVASGVAADSLELTNALLAIVSDKTGYPVETLELDMDMEADLGIDSIKRVEILGAMQAQFPALPQIDTAALAELRTLGQIVQAMDASSGSPEPAQVDYPQRATETISAAPAAFDATVKDTASNAVVDTGIGVEMISAALLNIVSEKTGYPVETLELDMDMEADLGIDSIKRVEILGSLQAQFPNLPQVDAAELAELRTLGYIIRFMGSAGNKQELEPSQGVADQSPFDGADEPSEQYNPGIEQGVVVRRLLPPSDYLEFDLPEKHICLITDDGTETTPALARVLLDRHLPVVVLRLPDTVVPHQPLPEGVSSIVLTDLSEAVLQTSLEQVRDQYGPVAVFIYMDVPGKLGMQDVSFPDEEKSLVKLAFLAAKHLKNSLNQAAQRGRAAFMTVTHLDGAFGLGDEEDFLPVSGGLFGLVKTLNLEWEAVFCRAVDLSPALETQRAAECILAELHDPNRLITEVGYTHHERSTLTIAAVPVTGGKK